MPTWSAWLPPIERPAMAVFVAIGEDAVVLLDVGHDVADEVLDELFSRRPRR